MARPTKPVDPKVVEGLCKIGATLDEMSAVVGVSEDTLQRRFAAVLKKGRAQGKVALRRVQWREALKGNVAMLIWLGKQLLGQKEQPIQEATIGGDTLRAALQAMDRLTAPGPLPDAGAKDNAHSNGNGTAHGNGSQ